LNALIDLLDNKRFLMFSGGMMVAGKSSNFLAGIFL